MITQVQEAVYSCPQARVWTSIENNKSCLSNCGTASESQWWNYSNTTAWASCAQWYIHVPPYSVAQPRAIGMDISWFWLLSSHPKRKQGEQTALSSTASKWSFWECHVQWWSLDPTWNTLEKVLQKEKRETAKQASNKDSCPVLPRTD